MTLEKTDKLSQINHTYSSIICEAIEFSEKLKLTVNDIYKYLDLNFSKYLNKNWKNSVRHALCDKKYFVHIKRKSKEEKNFWMLSSNYKNELENKRKKRNKKTVEELNLIKKVKNEYEYTVLIYKRHFIENFYRKNLF